MATKPRPTRPNSHRTMVFLLLTCFVLLLLPDSVYPVKSEYLSPAARRFRLERRQTRQNASRARAPSTPNSRLPSRSNAPRSTPYDVDSALHHSRNTRALPLLPRQLDNESCNNITITPPGFDGSCTVLEPCPNGACCGKSGFCGYGSDFCGDGCTSNCNAVAECGPNAAPGHEDCPLNVCCSKFGFCGSTDDFCGANCVGDHCGSPSIPSGVNSPVTSRLIGYYEGVFETMRPMVSRQYPRGRIYSPQLRFRVYRSGTALLTLLVTTFAVVPASASDVPQYKAFTDLKQSNPDLKTYISVGGWSFNDPPTQHVFSDVASTTANSQAFATSLVNFLVTYGFDGVDIDWEYPVACERGGVPADTANMVSMFQIIRSTFSASGHTFGLTFTAPSSYWYLQHFDLLGLLSYADWVNLMSYDLHGVWDAKDVFIGNIVQAHTNLTEIEESIGLFQRVGVPLDRIVLGLGFYGRSFQLTDPACSTPGCSFNGPAPGGPCTGADGTLSFAEIQDILSRNSGATPVYDQTAQVKYLVYDTNNWVSYDDHDTFTAKVNWARGAGFGGLMVWSADQDDFNSTALAAVLGEDPSQIVPRSLDQNSKDGKQCVQPGCGQTCPSGYVQMTDVTDGELANLCNGVCNVGEITLAVDSWGTGAKCSSGHKAFCCQSGLTADEIARATDCQWCIRTAIAQFVLRSCNDNVCPAGTFTKATDYYGDTNIFHACLMQEKSYCCRPPDGTTTTSPFSVDDLFPNPPSNGDLSWDLQDDPIDENAPNGGADANDNSFGLIAMDGPSNLLSSMAVESDWVLVGCTGQTDTMQTVTAYCRKKDNDPASGCSAVFESGAKNTIVKLPSGCGGPYARLHSLEVNNSIALAGLHATKKPADNLVYMAEFDFDFSRMSETRAASDGSVLLRVDATTLPGYWSEIDTADPNSPARRELEERWFGAFGDWLSRLNKVKSNTKADLGMSKSFQSVLYSASQMCASEDGTTMFSSSLTLTASGNAQANVEYGFYLEGTLFPPAINQAYVYVSSHGSATIGLELAGRAAASYNSNKVAIIPPVFWPGLSYPGIVSIGPSLNIYGQLQGSLAVSGNIGASVTYPFPEVHVSLGIVGSDPSQNDRGIESSVETIVATYDVAPTFDVSLSGSLSIHAIPEASLTFDLLPNTPVHVGARAYVALDGAVTLSFAADTSAVDASVVASADVTTGVEATAGPSQYTLGPFNLFHTDLTLYQQSLSFGDTTQVRLAQPAYYDLVEGGVFSRGAVLSGNFTPRPFVPLGQPLDRRSIIGGTLTCPATVDNSGSASCDQQLADDDPADADPDDTTDELFRRSEFIEGLLENRSLEKRVKVIGCTGPSISPPSYRSTTIAGYWYFAQPANPTDVSIVALNQKQQGVSWAREHVYEVQLLTQFMSDVLLPQVFGSNTNTWCTWIKANIFRSVQFAPNIKVQLSSLLAATEPTGNALMPALTAEANSAKQAFISGKRRFRAASTLRNAKLSPGNLVYLIRAAANSIEYMNDNNIRLEFLRVGRLVEQQWVNFLALNGNQLNGVPFNVQQAYRTWVNGLLANYGSNALQFFNDALQALSDKMTAAGGTVQIGVLKDCSSTKVTFDMNQFAALSASVQNLANNGITWTYP
ncbi:hypothetical protein GSI_05257 [Ganoderma sinense ZZ0214-1]|uniref:Uncharacterized protein n=1 Tax=Ganoderma sinense ZZ0214-1 TaxID=1077348 RepID=A0A2G8SFK4_9APHY|nr:hypothetical protein GSI_05257 [Ganoderma sinense ZZ0214-1]